jgi:hypothetical protein
MCGTTAHLLTLCIYNPFKVKMEDALLTSWSTRQTARLACGGSHQLIGLLLLNGGRITRVACPCLDAKIDSVVLHNISFGKVLDSDFWRRCTQTAHYSLSAPKLLAAC